MTLAYLDGRRYAPRGAAWRDAVAAWRDLRTDPDAHFDKHAVIDATVPDLVLSESEQLWIRACWQAATANHKEA